MSRQSAAPAHANSRPKLLILVADDNSINRKVIEAMLLNGGYEVRLVEDGDEAVRAYRTQLPDIVLMDVSMPKLNGLQATAQIRSLEAGLGHRATIVAVTAHAMPGDREACLDAGMDEYLAKPVSYDELLELIRTFAQRQSG